MTRAIIAHAARFDRDPAEVYDDYLLHPEGYRLRWAYESWLRKKPG